MTIPVLLAIAVSLSLVCAVGTIYIFFHARSSRQRILRGLETAIGDQEGDFTNPDHSKIRRLLSWIRVHLNFHNSKKLQDRMRLAGLRSEWHADAYVAVRVLTPLMALALSTFLPQAGFFGAAILVFLGFLLPDLWLSTITRRRRERIRLALPDTLDLLVICVEAGLGLDQALYRVGAELSIRHKAVSEELAQINMAQRAGKPRIDAWRSFAERIHLEEVDSFVAMLWQSDRFGTPIIRALATFSETLRTARRQKAEELAAKTTIKLIFPLVLFIFPSLFVVLLGPAALNVMHSFKGLF